MFAPYDPTPYADRDDVRVVYVVSVYRAAEDGRRYVYLDRDGERVARQRFVDDGTTLGVTVRRWLDQLLNLISSDPEGRNACGGCGNYVLGGSELHAHAPDCRWSRWQLRGGR